MNIPTYLTLARIAAIPLSFAVWYVWESSSYGILFAIFLLAAATDWLDGYLARRLNAITPFGAMLDQIADKLLVASFLLILVHDHHLPTALAAILIVRDLFISGLREHLALKAIPLPVGKSGKWKTALQLVGIQLVLGGIWLDQGVLLLTGHAALCAAAFFALSSAWVYSSYMRPAGVPPQ
jgi:CDP-diacylglycerol--glycerol-3-phosphate 3-phosphatidyltransferase